MTRAIVAKRAYVIRLISFPLINIFLYPETAKLYEHEDLMCGPSPTVGASAPPTVLAQGN